MKLISQAALLAALCLAGAGLAQTQEPDAAPPETDGVAAAGDHGEGVAALRVFVDPETGRRVLAPTPQQRAAMDAAIARNPAFSQSSEGLVEVPVPGGGFMIHLQGRFQSVYTVTRTSDGRLSFACSDPAHAALGPHAHPAVPVKLELE
jgi:hypothetical protein